MSPHVNSRTRATARHLCHILFIIPAVVIAFCIPMPEPASAGQADKWSLWSGGTKLRGANIHQRQVYPELDGTEYMGLGPIGAPYVQKDFDRLAALGANYVNISHPGLFTEKPPYKLNQAAQNNLDNLLKMIAKANMYAVISFRTGPGRSEFTFVLEDVGDWFDESYLNERVWKEQAAQDAWAAMWRHTAKRYKGHPVVAGYDLMVEPNSNESCLSEVLEDSSEPGEFYPRFANSRYDWNRMYPRLIAAIRTVDKKTPILVGAMGYSAVSWLPYLKPVKDKRTVYTVHQYAPANYTHALPSDRCCAYPGKCDLDWDDQCDDRFDLDGLVDLLATIDEFKAKTGRPVAVNEFGVHRWVPGGNYFMDDSMNLFDQRGLNHALWSWYNSGRAYTEVQHAFNFRAGPKPKNRKDVKSSKLIEVIRKNWKRNEARPGKGQ